MKSITSKAFHCAVVLSLILVMCGCSAIKYLTNDQSAETDKVYRFPISSAEIKKFFGGIRAKQVDLDGLYAEACYFQDQRKHKFALQNFRRILEADPHYVKAYNGMGVSYDMLGDHLVAIEAYRRALEIDPKADYVYNNLGYSLFLVGDTGLAIDAFEKAVNLNPENKKYHNNLGLAYAKKGKMGAAYAELRSGGEEAKAHYYLGKFYYDEGSYDQALDQMTKAIEVDPKLSEARIGQEAAASMVQIAQAKAVRAAESAPGVSMAGKPRDQIERKSSDGQVVIAANDLKRESSRLGNQKRPAQFQAGLIEISNGNGVNRMARKVGQYLGRNGFGTPRLTNASHFNFPETTIYYCDGYLQTAYRLAESIPGYQNMEVAARLDRPETKIKVRIGRDLIPYSPVFENS